MSLAPPTDPASRLMERMAGKWVVQAIATAAELGIADALDEPRSLEDLASRLRCRPEPLLRLLRVLVGEGLLEQRRDDAFALTPEGEPLRTGALRDLVRFVGSRPQWDPWPELAHCLRTGETPFARVHGRPLFDWLAEHPAEAALYDAAVDVFTRTQAQSLAALPSLGEVRALVDVGGGRGTLLLELLPRRPEIVGVLFDRPEVIEAARPRFLEAGLAERCRFVGGDFFAAVPEGADLYVIKHVVHNWDDDQAIALLRRCAEAMSAHGRIWVVEAVLLPGNRRDGARLMDLEMLVLTGTGRERSKPEFRRLFARAGLRLTDFRPVGGGAWLLEGRRA